MATKLYNGFFKTKNPLYNLRNTFSSCINMRKTILPPSQKFTCTSSSAQITNMQTRLHSRIKHFQYISKFGVTWCIFFVFISNNVLFLLCLFDFIQYQVSTIPNIRMFFFPFFSFKFLSSLYIVYSNNIEKTIIHLFFSQIINK